ncbi:MAG: NAD(P)/FAD-dependent oxidoreductase [Armatimonadetes bacterium]|nr:NAD(P)/FAD-dependent oxidoreductase [Armatimonadota bacterium]
MAHSPAVGQTRSDRDTPWAAPGEENIADEACSCHGIAGGRAHHRRPGCLGSLRALHRQAVEPGDEGLGESSFDLRPCVVILGAGFAGLWALRRLAQVPVDVLLIDRQNYHTFLPLLYQVAAAELEPEEIAYPVRSVLRTMPNAQFLMAEVRHIDLAARRVEVADRAVPYDFLVVALGSITHFYGVPGAAEHAFPLKTLDHGVDLRSHILTCFERAVHEPDTVRRRRALAFAIVGGGPTGVEFAGALAELIHGPLTKDYPSLDIREIRVVLVEALDSLLPGLPQRLRDYALSRLRSMGVQVLLQSPVTRVTADSLHLRDGAVVLTETVVWTAGVRGDPLAQAWGLPAGRGGRVTVRPSLQSPGYAEVYVVGDLANVEAESHPLPMIAPVAIQQGEAAAQNILRQVRGATPVPFRYRDRGTMVAIGRNAAVAEFRGRAFTGFSAWVLWLSVHLFNLIGFRNRLLVLINWAWDYFFFERAVRLIVPSEAAKARPDLLDATP